MKRLAIFLVMLLMFLSAGCQTKNEPQNNDVQVHIKSEVQPAPSSQSSSEDSTTSQTASTPAKQAQPSTSQAGTQNQTASSTPPKIQVPAKESFTVVVSKSNGSEELIKKVLEIKGKKSVLSYLRDVCNVVDEGGFIKSIENLKAVTSSELTQEQKKSGILGVDWFIYLNGEKTARGANDIFPKDGDVINFDYREWSYKDLAP